MRRDLLFAIAVSAALLVPQGADAQGKGHRHKTAADTTGPTVPTGLAASGLTSTSVTLSWSASTDTVGVTGYRIYSSGSLIASTGSTALPISGLIAANSYAFTVAAFDGAGNISAPSTALAVTTPAPAPAPAPDIVWSSGMETGTLSEWSEQVNTGSAVTSVVSAASQGIASHSGAYVMKQAVTGSSGGTRMFRYPEIIGFSRSATTFYWSWWDYYPAPITFGIYDSYIIWGVVSKDGGGNYNPLWNTVFSNTGQKLVLVWSPNNMAPTAGPHAGESGKRIYTSDTVIPVGQWVYFETMITPKADFTGALKVWLNGQLVFDLSEVKMMYPDTGQGDPLLALEQTGYGSNLTPTPAVHYLDDFTLSLGRIPYAP
jgi:fibronectin type III domain protein